MVRLNLWQPMRGDAFGASQASPANRGRNAAGSGRTDAPTEPRPAPAPGGADATAGAAPAPAEFDRLTGLPVLPRFPWVSRRSLALEEAARRRAAFMPPAVLGAVVDTSA